MTEDDCCCCCCCCCCCNDNELRTSQLFIYLFCVDRLLLLPVDVQLYNSGDAPLLVRLDAADMDTITRTAVATAAITTTHPPSIAAATVESANTNTLPPLPPQPSLSSGTPPLPVSQTAPSAATALATKNGLPSCVWVGLTGHVVHIAPKSHARLTLQACLPAVGVYELHSLTVRAAPLSENLNEQELPSLLNLDSLSYVKQEHWWSALLIVESAVRS